MTRALRIGLTGGIACGKSLVMRRLAASGCATIDLDRVAHDVMEPPGPVFDEVVAAFGEGILSPEGRVDRRALGEVVFRDGPARQRLEAIVHPRVRQEEARRAAASGASAVVVTEAALLVETGMHLRFDRLVVVHCRADTQLARLQARDGIGETEARRKLSAQMPIEEKRGFGHLEVDTEGSWSDTERRADELAAALDGLARRPVLAAGGLDRARALDGLVHGPQAGPRGLDPLALLLDMGRTGGIEMEGLAARLRPPVSGPWYRAARPGEGAPYPIALVGPVAAFSLLRAPGDEEFAAGLMASVARLSHPSPDAIGNACAFVLATRAAWGLSSPSPQVMRADAPRWMAQARRWAGSGLPDRLERVLALASSDPSGERLREACGRELGEPGLAGTLLGRGGDGAGGARKEAAAALEGLIAAVSGREPG